MSDLFRTLLVGVGVWFATSVMAAAVFVIPALRSRESVYARQARIDREIEATHRAAAPSAP